MKGVSSSAVADLCLGSSDSAGLAPDVDLVGSDGEAVSAHRIVLAAVSKNLEMALKAVEADNTEYKTKIIVPDLKGEEIRQFMQGLYQVMQKVIQCFKLRVLDLFNILRLSIDIYCNLKYFSKTLHAGCA